MAKEKKQTVVPKRETPKKKRTGIHAKTRASVSKHSRNYLKPYRGQGR